MTAEYGRNARVTPCLYGNAAARAIGYLASPAGCHSSAHIDRAARGEIGAERVDRDLPSIFVRNQWQSVWRGRTIEIVHAEACSAQGCRDTQGEISARKIG